MGLEILQKKRFLANLVLPMWLWDAKQKFNRLSYFLQQEEKILEIGSGLGTVTYYFKLQGLQITPLDIQNLSVIANVTPIIYDGQKLPFADNSFDTVLLLTVLHHTTNPVSVIKEAARVSRKIIIIEDIYLNCWQKYLTFWVDSLVNFEFIGHPHTNQTDANWKNIFHELNLTISYSSSYEFLLFFRQAIYVLEKPKKLPELG